MIDILYEDDDIIVCVKPVGILSQQDSKGNKCMTEILNSHLADNNFKGSVYVVHRLDKNVGGVMIFAKSSKAAASLSKSIQENKLIKQYLAVVQGRPEEESGIYEDLLFKHSSKNKSYVVSRMRKGVKKASLEYRRIDSYYHDDIRLSLVCIRLHTGRTHQIRVQFSSRKMPLLGDNKYGSRDNKCDVALWSYKLGFPHPKNGRIMEFEVKPSEDVYPWNLFKLNLDF